MPRPPESSDYFFVIESGGEYSQAQVFAGGEGKKVMPALTRLAMLHAANDSRRMDHLPIPALVGMHDTLYDAVSEASTFKLPDEEVYFGAEPGILSGVLHVHTGQGLFQNTVVSHRRNVFEQVRNGSRSPRDAHEELTDLARDIQTLQAVSSRWFDTDGIQLVPPVQRERSAIRDPKPLLRRVTRRREDRALHPALKDEFFAALPKNARAYYVGQLVLRKSGTFPRQNRPFLYGTSLQTVFGYVAAGDDEFIPVLTQLADDHPLRLPKKRSSRG